MTVWLFWLKSDDGVLCGEVSDSLQNIPSWNYILLIFFLTEKTYFVFKESFVCFKV